MSKKKQTESDALAELIRAASSLLFEYGGDIPDWLQESADELSDAIRDAKKFLKTK